MIYVESELSIGIILLVNMVSKLYEKKKIQEKNEISLSKIFFM